LIRDTILIIEDFSQNKRTGFYLFILSSPTSNEWEYEQIAPDHDELKGILKFVE